MISNFKFQISNSQRGTTLVELLVVICIIAIFVTILVSNFPEIMRQLALSRATYKMAQDLRRTEDLALSGINQKDMNGKLISVKGYGIYIPAATLTSSVTKYAIYAYVDAQDYNGGESFPLCEEQDSPTSDCVIEVIDVSNQNVNLIISSITDLAPGGAGDMASSVNISFIPPNPTTNIKSSSCASGGKGICSSGVGIVLGLKNGTTTRAVLVKTSGLISVE